jgi:pimeloyl-ACP methyl ester carboxylesterase
MSFDLLGCGASGWADSWKRCTIDEYGADLTALCDRLDIDRPVVIGHSLGAPTTPDRFRRSTHRGCTCTV